MHNMYCDVTIFYKYSKKRHYYITWIVEYSKAYKILS